MSNWLLTMKPTFLTEWSALPAKEAHQVQKKLQVLAEDPNPDGHVKKKLKNMGGRLHRLRSGDYRIFYVFDAPYVSLLRLDKRDEATYDDDLDDASLGGLDTPESAAAPKQPDWGKLFASTAKAKKTPLPSKITKELLGNLKVPVEFHKKLEALQTQEDLLNCPGVPDDLLLKLDEALIQKPLAEVLQQPDLLANVDDLLKYKEGELLGFLLKLNPEQEKFVAWGLKGNGPTLLKGGPGTGKSTVALYRTRAMLQALRKAGKARPRILFTTYTTALVNYSKQLLASLLGPQDAELIDVRTADSLTKSIASAGRDPINPADNPIRRKALRAALGSLEFQGNRLQQKAMRQAIERLTPEYLSDEIDTVIDARALTSLGEYLAAVRPGRGLALNKLQRTAVWAARTAYHQELEKAGVATWQQIRGWALQRVREGKGPEPYDAVLVDEAQDLDPCVLQLLVELCPESNRLFLAADANQSIYGSGYRWSDVHARLKFQGHTGVLKANHRSTRELGEAAHSYLANGVLDADGIDQRVYVHNGPLPVLREATTPVQEAKLLAKFLPAAAKLFRLGLGSCAVFCPSEQVGTPLATALKDLGIDACFVNSKSLDLTKRCVKVMALRTAKGLEFPVVAIAGFPVGDWPAVPDGQPPEERLEQLNRERRTIFVGMTRAMRGLLMVVPTRASSSLLKGFSPEFWNLADPTA